MAQAIKIIRETYQELYLLTCEIGMSDLSDPAIDAFVIRFKAILLRRAAATRMIERSESQAQIGDCNG